MASLGFDPLGFWLPLLVSGTYARRTFASARTCDYVLFALALAGTRWTVHGAPDGIRMIGCYILATIVRMLANGRVAPDKTLPAGAVFFFYFFSMVIPDVWGAITFAETYAPGKPAIVGGVGLMDGLVIGPFGGTALYFLACVIQWRCPDARGKGPIQTLTFWDLVIHHFRPGSMPLVQCA